MGEKRRGIPFVVSAPSGAGKTTLCKKAVDFFDGLVHSVSYTTRPPRPGESDGVEYLFVDDAAFEAMAAAGEFLEHAEVHGSKYGTSARALEALLDKGLDVILEIDVQGAEEIRKRLDDGVYIFILPPSLEACAERLRLRGDSRPGEIERRLRVAEQEMKKASMYGHTIVNDDLDEAFEEFKAVIASEREKRSGRE